MKNLVISIERLPLFSAFTTNNLPKTSKVENGKRSPRKPVLNKKYQQENIFKKVKPSKKSKEKCCEYIEESGVIKTKRPELQKGKVQQTVVKVKKTKKINELQAVNSKIKNKGLELQKEKIQQIVKVSKNKKIDKIQEVDSKTKNKGTELQIEKVHQLVQVAENKNIEERQEVKTKMIQLKSQNKRSTPLVNRLREFEYVNYFESSLEETLVKNIHINDGVEPKVPIYRQAFLVETKSNSQDPYALDIDCEKDKKQKREKPKRNKAIRKRVVQKGPLKYDENINKALNRVMMKVKAKQVVNENTVTEKASESSLHHKSNKVESLTEPIIEKTVCGNTVENLSEEDFLGFDNINTSNLSGVQPITFSYGLQENLQHSNLNTSPQNISVTNNSVIEYHSTPNRKRSENSRINILSNISIGNNIDSSLLKTKRNIDSIKKSHNLFGAFHSGSPVLSNQSVISTHGNRTLQNDEQIHEHLDIDDYDTESESDEDEFFGFKETIGTSPVKVNLRRKYDLKRLPWRFQGVCRRNPHILKIKKNGLPCNQQEMVIDHKFVQRIENLSANNINKHPEPALPKSPVQTTMLNFIETRRDHPEHPPRLSLFDYEDFDVAKPPRKPLGELQPNQIVSTPRKAISINVESPNVSIIPSNESDENLVHRHCNRKKVLEKKRDDLQKEQNVDILPSILNNINGGDTESDQHLFEDTEGEKNIDYSIKLPTIRYGNKRQWKRMREGPDGEEKISKKKKKGMMTKTEEVEYEAWAAKTNARFEEEDRHELTIE